MNPAPSLHIEGLPVWAQIVISILTCIAALGVAFKGYFREEPLKSIEGPSQTTALLAAASIADMGAMRHLSDVMTVLSGQVTTLSNVVTEATHHERNNVEVSREICSRMRELCEQMERTNATIQGMSDDARRWNKRDEDRR